MWPSRKSLKPGESPAISIATKREPYRELGGTYFDERERQRVEQRLVHRLERLGYQVTLQATAPPQPAIA
jgi:hypothetical protein